MSHDVAVNFSVKRFDEDEEGRFLLLREMHHRFANSLTVLAITMRREFGWSVLPGHRQSLDRLETRIVAFAELHRFLIVGAETKWTSTQFYIERLCDALAEALLKPLGVRCEVSADAAFFPCEYCELIGLVIAELVTNSAKHAFRGRDNGLVRVEFLNTAGTCVCIVSDNGIGAPITSIGVGSKILAALLDRLGGEIASKSGPEGTSSMIRWPIPACNLPRTQ
jgi:two-component sensor histidine kinase